MSRHLTGPLVPDLLLRGAMRLEADRPAEPMTPAARTGVLLATPRDVADATARQQVNRAVLGHAPHVEQGTSRSAYADLLRAEATGGAR